MMDAKTLITQVYVAFNRRDMDGALALMSEDVNWPKASEGGRVVGKEAIRAYWTRQWAEFNPHVDPVEVREVEVGKIDVSVHQVVRDLKGDLLSDQVLVHSFLVLGGLIERMDVGESVAAFGRGHSG